MPRLQRAITNYDSTQLSPSIRAQIIAMAPKYIVSGPASDCAHFISNIPGVYVQAYFNLTDLYANEAQLPWLLARAATNGIAEPETVLLHAKTDTVVTILNVDYLIKGWGGGTAASLIEARLPIYYAPVQGVFPRLITNHSTAALRQVHREFAIENLLTVPYATGIYPRGLMFDNSASTLFNLDVTSMAHYSRAGRDVWGVNVLSGGGAWAATGNYVYRIVPTTSLGDGIASKDIPVTITSNTQRVQLDYAITGTGVYKIYRKPAAASWTTGDWRIATVTAVSSFTDTGLTPVGGSGGPSRAGELYEAPAGMTLQSPEFYEWRWHSSTGLFIREFKDLIATNPGWLAGRPCRNMQNISNVPSMPTDWINRYVNFNGTGAPISHGVLREFEGTPVRNTGLDEPGAMYAAFEAAATAGMDVWEAPRSENIQPGGTITMFGRVLTDFDVMSGIIGLAWLVRTATTQVLGWTGDWTPSSPGWQLNTRAIWDLDLGTPVGPPSVLASGTIAPSTAWKVWGREYTQGYVTTRFRGGLSESMAAANDVTVTLPAGTWRKVVDLDGNTGGPTVTSYIHQNGQSYVFKREGGPPADTTAPSAVTLAVTGVTPNTITLGWTAPGDDGNTGTASAYEMRRSVSPITAGNFATATLVSGLPAPLVAGTAQSVTVTGLLPGATWFFAIRTADEALNWSPVSNSPSGTTTAPPPDVTAPAAVTNLALSSISAPDQDYGDVRFTWTAPGDDLGAGTATAYDIRLSFGQPIMKTSPIPFVTNGSLTTSHAPQVAGNFVQDVPGTTPTNAVATVLASGQTQAILHFIPPATALYAACLSAICGAVYQLTAFGGPSQDFRSTTITAGAPDGAFGAPTAAAVIAGNLISRTFQKATVYANLSTTSPVGYPGGTLAALGAAIVQLAGYGTTNVPGEFPQRGGLFWGQTTSANIAALAQWRTVVLNNSQTEGPTDGVNSPTPVASLRAARAAAVPTHPAITILESHNGLNVFVDGAGNPSVYWPLQQRLWAYCQANGAWIYEGGLPLESTGGLSGSSIVRLFDMRHDGLQEFYADQITASVARCGADGAFGDEFHAIHPLRGALHPTVPQDVDQTAGMARLLQITASDFASAAPLNATLPAPLVAGTVQTVDEIELPAGATIYAALVSTDEAGNVSLLSNVPSMTIPWLDVDPPAAVANLALVSAGSSNLTVQWSAPAEFYQPTGANVAANGYDLRYSTSPINSGNFAAATQVTGEPAPGLPGTSQSMTLTGLAPNTPYYVAIKSVDGSGNWSAISNVLAATTTPAPDTTPPAGITDLAVIIPTPTSLTLRWTAPGDDGAVGQATTYDIRISTSPITALNFGAAVQLPAPPTPAVAGTLETKVASPLLASTLYYFAIKATDDAGNVSVISNLPSGTTTALPDTVPPAAVADLAVINATSASLTLTWTAPGDDGAVGTASSYDIRISTAPINSGNFGAATVVTGPPLPAVAGTAQSKLVAGLAASTLYYFAIKATDEAANVSAISNLPSGTTTSVADVIAPATTVDLVVTSTSTTTLSLAWTAPGDDAGAGTATSYDVRYSTSLIDAGNFGAATQASGEPAPGVAGSAQAMTITGLAPGVLYYVALKASDEVPNTSGLSNVVSGTTTPLADVTPPTAISNLTAPLGLRTSTTVTLNWTATGDDAGAGIATLYDVRFSTSPIDAGNFGAAATAAAPPTPAAAGTAETMTVTGLVPETLYYFAVKAGDEAGNWSTISNVVSRITAAPPLDTMPPGDVTDLVAVTVGPNSVSLEWTATGDDGGIGLAAAYDLRYSLNPITAFTFAGATPATLEPAPQVAGSRQGMTVGGLEQSTLYYFAVRVLDEAGNSSSPSNVVAITTGGANVYRIRCLFVNRVRVRVEA